MMSEKWIRLEPACELEKFGGERIGWELVVAFDPDWQDWGVSNADGIQQFRVYVHDEMVAAIREAAELAEEEQASV